MHRESLEVAYSVTFTMTESERKLLAVVIDDWLKFRGAGAGAGLVEAADHFENLLRGMVPEHKPVKTQQ